MDKLMKRRIFALIMLVLLCFIYASYAKILPDELYLAGDVRDSVKVNEMWGKLEKTSFTFEGKRYRGVALNTIIERGFVQGEYDVYLVANDGFMVCFAGDSIESTYIAYSKDLGFYYLSEKHPVNSRVKHIDEIIIKRHYEEGEVPQNGLHIISELGDIHKSVGEMLTNAYETYPYEDGVSSKGDVSISVMQQKRVIRLTSLVGENIESVLVMSKLGSHDYVYADEYFVEINYNSINLFTEDKTEYFRDIEGVIINPPATSVMNAYYDSLFYLEDGERVLMIFADGLSYYQYEYIRQNNPEVFLSGLDNVKKATTVFKPVTNAGFAAMITGVSPEENMVPNREHREIHAKTIFDAAAEMGKTALLIESEILILNTDVEVVFNFDKDEDGYTDNEVFDSAMQNIHKGYDYMLVHFHGIDDAGHNYGPFGAETLTRIAAIDAYIEKMTAEFEGKVILVADHGMHQTEYGGDHGQFVSEDMFVIYAVFSGSK